MDHCTTTGGTEVWVNSCWKFQVYNFQVNPGYNSYLHVLEIRPSYLVVAIISNGRVAHRTSVDKDFIDKQDVVAADDEEIALYLLGAI